MDNADNKPFVLSLSKDRLLVTYFDKLSTNGDKA